VIGSAGVYGIYRNDDNVITARSKLFPDTVYEKSKAAAQVIVEQAGLAPNSFAILQPTNVIGEGDQSRKLLHLFKILQKDNFYFLNRNAQVNYVYARKIAEVVREIVHRSYFPNQSFIINDPMRIEDFIRFCSDALGLRSPSKSIPAILQPLLYLLARVSNFLPDSLSHFSLGRYHELTSERYYSAIETDNQFQNMEKTDIRSGINNLVEYYRCNKWL
jgi:nucleoside-diphosphate-sugar epimerase